MTRHGLKVTMLAGFVASLVLITRILTTDRVSLLGHLVILDDAPQSDDSSEKLRHYLRASSDSIAYSCGGKEVLPPTSALNKKMALTSILTGR